MSTQLAPEGLLGDAVDIPDDSDLTGTRIAIVTYELVGLTRTGGIGTAYTSLAHALAEVGAHVDVLFTGWPAPGVAVDDAVARYADAGITVEVLDPAAIHRVISVSEHARRAQAAYGWLLDRDAVEPYDVVHAPECAGHGSAIAAAKRGGTAFASTTVVVGAHGSSRWVRDINGDPFGAPDQLTLDVLERRSIEDADVVVSPSRYLVDDMHMRGWRLPERTFVQQYVLPPRVEAAGAPAAVQELVFFGRLEVRKGVLLFCDALDRLAADVPADRLRVTFLGRPDEIAGRPGGRVVEERATAWPWPVRMLTDLDQPEAVAYLRGPGRLAVMPSLADNLPLTVLEGLGLGIPFVTTATGGIPEMLHPDDVARAAVAPEAGALAAALRAALVEPPAAPRFAIAPADNRDIHLRWHAGLRGVRAAAMDVPDADERTGEHVVIATPGHVLAPNGEAVARAAARRAEADIVVYAARQPDGRVWPALGGPAPLVPVAGPLVSTGGALIRRLLVELELQPSTARELDDLLAALIVAGHRVLVLPDSLATVSAGVQRPPAALFDWWPSPEDAEVVRGSSSALAAMLPAPVSELTTVAALLARRLEDARSALERSEELVRINDRNWKEARTVLEGRDRELADTVLVLRETEDALAVERHRLATLRERRAVRAALALARVKSVFRRS